MLATADLRESDSKGETPLRLLVRPHPIRHEAAIGYLIRVARANGFLTPRQLWLATLNSQGAMTFDELVDWMGIPVESRKAILGPVPHYWKSTPTLLPGLCINDYNHHFIRWCPRCLADAPHLRSCWGLKLQCVCMEHRLLLADQCPHCGARQRIERNNLCRCMCGARLDGCEQITAPLNLCQLNEKLAGGSAAKAPFPALAASEWHRLVRFLGQFTIESQPERPGQISGLHHLDVASSIMSNAAELLADWPNNFNVLLAAIQGQESSTQSLCRSFGRLYRVLYRDLRAPGFQFLRDAFETYLHEHWWGFVCKRNRSLRPDTVAKHPRLTVGTVAREAGTSPAVVRHLLQAELIPGIEGALPSGRRVRSVHQDDIERIAALAEGAMSLTEAAELLALPERRIREMVTGELLTALVSRRTMKSAAWLFSREQLSKLSQLPALDHGSEKLVSFNQILRSWRLRKGEFVALVQAVLNGVLPNLAASAAPIGRVFLEVVQVRRWLKAHRLAGDDWLSVDLAAQTLGVKQQVAYGLIARGLLKTTPCSSNARAVSTGDIRVFKENYISLSELARQREHSPKWVLREIRAIPVCEPSVDGTRQYFFRRSETVSC